MQRRPIIVIFTLEDYTYVLYIFIYYNLLHIIENLKIIIKIPVIYSGQVLGRRVLPVKICSCPKRDMDREETDTHLQKNTVFRRNKKCISQDINHNNNRHHHSDSEPPPAKIIKLESSTSTENRTDNTYILPVNT